MIGSRRRSRSTTNVWPGYVDALSALLMLVIFMLLVYVVSQLFLSQTLSDRNSELAQLNQRLNEISQLLGLEKNKTDALEQQILTVEGDHSYIFQNRDGRIIFAIPYEGEHTLIGTTDEPWSYAEGDAKISDGEIGYLCDAASEYFEIPVTRDDIQWTYSGVRPLFDDHSRSAATVTRDFVFDYDNDNGAPVLSVFGGKITTYRVLALQAIRTLSDALDVDGDDWTKKAYLPGGDFAPDGFDALVDQYADRWNFIDRPILHRLVRAYGTDTAIMLEKVKAVSDLGQLFGAGLFELEIRWLIDREFACTAEDVLWRRSKLGLHMTDDQQQAVALWFDQQD